MAEDILEAIALLRDESTKGPVMIGTFADEELIILDKNRDVENSFDCPRLSGLTPEERDQSVATCVRMMIGRDELRPEESDSPATFVGKMAIVSKLFDSVDRITTTVRVDRNDDLRQVAWRSSFGLSFVEQIFVDGDHQLIVVSDSDEKEMLSGFVTAEMKPSKRLPEPKILAGTLDDEPVRNLVMRASAEATYEVVITTAVPPVPEGAQSEPIFGSITVYSMPEGILVLVNGDEGQLEMRWCTPTELTEALEKMLP